MVSVSQLNHCVTNTLLHGIATCVAAPTCAGLHRVTQEYRHGGRPPSFGWFQGGTRAMHDVVPVPGMDASRGQLQVETSLYDHYVPHGHHNSCLITGVLHCPSACSGACTWCAGAHVCCCPAMPCSAAGYVKVVGCKASPWEFKAGFACSYGRSLRAGV